MGGGADSGPCRPASPEQVRWEPLSRSRETSCGELAEGVESRCATTGRCHVPERALPPGPAPRGEVRKPRQKQRAARGTREQPAAGRATSCGCGGDPPPPQRAAPVPEALHKGGRGGVRLAGGRSTCVPTGRTRTHVGGGEAGWSWSGAVFPLPRNARVPMRGRGGAGGQHRRLRGVPRGAQRGRRGRRCPALQPQNALKGQRPLESLRPLRDRTFPQGMCRARPSRGGSACEERGSLGRGRGDTNVTRVFPWFVGAGHRAARVRGVEFCRYVIDR